METTNHEIPITSAVSQTKIKIHVKQTFN